MQKTIYSYEEALAASREYFNGNELSAKVFLDKYALRDNNGNLLELTPSDMHHRIAKEFARIEAKKFKKPLSEDYIFGLLDKFSKIIPQGSPMYGIGNPYQTVSISNCFVLEPPLDSYSSILKTDEELVQISKRRGGVGTDVSNLRPNGFPTHNAARTSTGAITFMKRYSNSTREVGQSGRRGALMLTMDIRHPESVIPWTKEDGEEFFTDVDGKKISSKYYNPKKLDFVTCKYDKSNVTGANISLRLTDDFMKAVVNKGTFEKKWPIENPVMKETVDAASAWDKIITSAHSMAEPGLLFWDTIIKESLADCYAKFGFQSRSTNPCGEIILASDDACRLLVQNLFAYVINPFTTNAYFDFNAFFEDAKIAQRLMDDIVDLEIEYVENILKKIDTDPEPEEIKQREKNLWLSILDMGKKGRRTGLGPTALGDTLAALGIKYGTEAGVEMCGRIYKTLKFAAYTSSADMAEELGAFPIWDHELEKNNPFLSRIKEEKCDLGQSVVSGHDLWKRIAKHGRRNIAIMTTAPTGSVSLLTKVINNFGSSSGIEPQFDITPYTRKKKGNPGDKNFRSDSVDQNGDHWMHFEVKCAALQDWMDVTGETDYTKSPWWEHCASSLDWTSRVKLQAEAQKHVDHSISSTVNLPNDVTVEKVKEIYETAWKMGCKGITVYRDGCRSGVLVRENQSPVALVGVPRTNSPKRPQSLPCDIHHIKVKGEDYFTLVGMLNNDPYEVFAGKNGFIPKSAKTGTLQKMKRGEYKLTCDTGTEISSVVDHIDDEEEAITRMASMSLRHGVDISYLVHQLEKVKSKDMSSFYKALCRALKKYIKEGTAVSGEECPECKGKLIRQDGCSSCKSCGWTKCQ